MSRIPFSSYLCVLGNNHQNLKILSTKWPIQNLFFFHSRHTVVFYGKYGQFRSLNGMSQFMTFPKILILLELTLLYSP